MMTSFISEHHTPISKNIGFSNPVSFKSQAKNFKSDQKQLIPYPECFVPDPKYPISDQECPVFHFKYPIGVKEYAVLFPLYLISVQKQELFYQNTILSNVFHPQ